jgi:hypothetical protein
MCIYLIDIDINRGLSTGQSGVSGTLDDSHVKDRIECYLSIYHPIAMTTGSIPTNQKTYQNNTEILNKQNKKWLDYFYEM